MVIGERLSMGHARALLGLESDAAIERVARHSLGRELYRKAGRGAGPTRARRRRRRRRQEEGLAPLPAARDLVRRLERALGVGELVEADPTRGHIELHYHSLDELDGLLVKILPIGEQGVLP